MIPPCRFWQKKWFEYLARAGFLLAEFRIQHSGFKSSRTRHEVRSHFLLPSRAQGANPRLSKSL